MNTQPFNETGRTDAPSRCTVQISTNNAAQSFKSSLGKWLSVCLRTKWLWARVQLQSTFFLKYLFFCSCLSSHLLYFPRSKHSRLLRRLKKSRGCGCSGGGRGLSSSSSMLLLGSGAKSKSFGGDRGEGSLYQSLKLSSLYVIFVVNYLVFEACQHR